MMDLVLQFCHLEFLQSAFKAQPSSHASAAPFPQLSTFDIARVANRCKSCHRTKVAQSKLPLLLDQLREVWLSMLIASGLA